MEKRVEFTNTNGSRLVGILSGMPESKTAPIIILCHGSHSGKDFGTGTSLTEILNKNNISTFRFDFYGHGESEGKFVDITTAELIDDILSAIKMLKQFGYKRIGLMGASMGGGASILAAGLTNDIYLLALKSPVIDFKELEIERSKEPEKHTEGLKYGWNRDSGNYNGYESLKKIKVPIGIVHGGQDTDVPTMYSEKAVHQNPKIILHLVNGADHRYSEQDHFQKMLEFLSNFIIQNSSD